MASVLQRKTVKSARTMGRRPEKNMESNITDHQYFTEDLELSEPHFEEEATLLSARPVVPLSEVPPESHSGKRLAFGLAIALAILAGAVGATFFYQRAGEGSATAVEDQGTPAEAVTVGGALSSGASGAGSPPQTRPAAQNVSTVNAPRKVVDSGSRGDSKIKNSAPAIPQKDNSGRVNETLQNSPDSQDEERNLSREERMEERRARRDAWRESNRDGRGRRRRRASDDLLRIREIFEGSPRP